MRKRLSCFIPLKCIRRRICIRITRRTMILRNAYYKTTSKNTQHLLSYLKRLGGKTLKCRRTYVFKLRWKEIEVNLRDRCQVQSSCEYLKHILESQNINERPDDIKVLIAEIIPIIKTISKYNKKILD